MAARRRKSVPVTPDPSWLRPALLILMAIGLFGLFSPEITDTDFWWHLRTGQYVVQQRSLPVPDPFAWTTANAPLAYPAEASIRQFNLRHEWLAQTIYFLTWNIAGFAGIVASRVFSMMLVCGLTGLMVWRRTSGSFYAAVAATLACASVLAGFALDRPFQFTFLFLAATLAVMEFRRWLWILPVIFVIWANCHGGFFLGYLVLGAYGAELLWRRKRDVTFWGVVLACVAAGLLNPNGLTIFRALRDYRSSYMTSRLLEWAPPLWWPPSAFSVLLVSAAGLMLWKARQVRVADWLLLAAFGTAAATAQRNTGFVGIVAPILIAGYWPSRWRIPAVGRILAPAVLAAGILILAIGGHAFRLRAAEWRFPSGAADFLSAHSITQPMFNTWEHGGYLIWRLWPQERVFIDGRALSERLFLDYARILYNHDNDDGQPSGEELLDRYGIQAIVMNTFEPATGNIYVLAPALADPAQKTWKLVYQDAAALVFLRNPPPGMTVLNSLDVLSHMEAECAMHLEREPQHPRCARSVAGVFLKIGDNQRARQWLGTYLAHALEPDPEARQAYGALSNVR